MADPRVLLDLDPRHAEGAEALAKLLLLRRAYRIISDCLDHEAIAHLKKAGIEVLTPEALAGETVAFPAGPTAVLMAEAGFAIDLARRAGGLPRVRVP